MAATPSTKLKKKTAEVERMRGKSLKLLTCLKLQGSRLNSTSQTPKVMRPLDCSCENHEVLMATSAAMKGHQAVL